MFLKKFKNTVSVVVLDIGFAEELFRTRQCYSRRNINKRSANGHTAVKYITPDKIIIVKVSEELPAIFSAPSLG